MQLNYWHQNIVIRVVQVKLSQNKSKKHSNWSFLETLYEGSMCHMFHLSEDSQAIVAVEVPFYRGEGGDFEKICIYRIQASGVSFYMFFRMQSRKIPL